MSRRATAELEARLAKLAGREYALVVGHANTALYLALTYLRNSRGAGEVIVPPIVCSSVVQTILYAGFEPVFVDVTLPLCTIDPAAAVCAINHKTRAIVAVHIFGYSADMPALVRLAEEHDVLLIEDAAQSIGGQISGRPHGNWGDASLYSFGATKIVAAGAGGALLCDDRSMYSHAIAEAVRMPELNINETYKLLSLSHRNLTHGLTDLLRVKRTASVCKSYTNLVEFYEPLYLHALADNRDLIGRIVSALDGLDYNIQARQQRTARYYQGLSDLAGKLQLPDPDVCDGTVWRYTMLVTEDTDAVQLTAALRRARLNASNHYWSVAQLLQGRTNLANADFASPRLLNLWVDTDTPLEEADRAVEIIRAELIGSDEDQRLLRSGTLAT